MKRKLLIAGAAVVVVVIVGIVIGVLNLDRIVDSRKDFILGQVETRIGRDVSVGDIGVALFPSIGVRLDEVSISEDPAFATDPFLQAQRITVTVRVMPLFKKRVEVKRLILHEPAIAVMRDEAGRFNYEGMAEAAAGPETEPSDGAAALPLVLAFADIEDGVVHFVDATTNTEHTVRDIDFSASNVGLGQEVSFSLRAAVMGESHDVEIEGRGGPIASFSGPASLAGVPVELKARLGPFAAASLAALMPAGGNTYGADQVSLSVDAAGTFDAFEVTALDISAALFGSKESNVRAKIAAGPVDLTMPPVAGSVPVSGEWTVGPLELADVQKAMASDDAPAPMRVRGPVSASGTFSGGSGKTNFSLDVNASAAEMVVDTTFTKPAGVAARAIASGSFDTTGATISKLEATFGPLKLSGGGSVSKTGGMKLDVKGETPVAGWEKMLPALASMSATGAIAFDAKVSGTPAPGALPGIAGTARITGAGATLPAIPGPVRDANATVSFTEATAKVSGATITVGKSKAAFDLNATALKPLSATFKATSAEAWRNDFNAPPPAAKPLPRPEVLRDVVVSGTLREQKPGVVLVSGEARSATGTISNVDYTGLQATFESTPELVNIKQFSARALDGDVSGSGTFHPQAIPPRFEFDTKIQRVNLAEYFRYKSEKLADAIEGRIDMNLTMSGSGAKAEEIMPSLRGTGGAVVIDGALLGVNLVNELVRGIESLPITPPGFAQQMKAKNPKLFDQNKTVFKNLKSQLTIADGRVKTDDVLLDAGDFRIVGGGWVGFDRALDLDATIVLSDKLTGDIVASIREAKYLLNANGRLEVPLKFGGDLNHPRPMLDSSALVSRIQKAALQGSVDDAKGQVKNQVKDFLSGFGKKKAEEKPPEEKKTP